MDYEVVEGDGAAYRLFQEMVERCNEEMQIALCGSPVAVLTTDAPSYSAGRIHQEIRAGLVRR